MCGGISRPLYAQTLLRYVRKLTDRILFCCHASQDMTGAAAEAELGRS